MHGGNALGLQRGLQAQVEIRRVHTDEDVGALVQQAFAQLFAHAQQTGQALENLDAVAVHGQSFAGPVGLESALSHLWAANPAGLQIRPACAQPVQHQPGEQVARGLAGHHGYLRG